MFEPVHLVGFTRTRVQSEASLTSYGARRHLLLFAVKCACMAFLVSADTFPVTAQQSMPAPDQPKKLRFEIDILPLVTKRCVQCHGTQTMVKSLSLSSYAGAIKGSE